MKLKTDITNVRVARSLWCIGAASLMVAGNAGAALLTGLVNGDFSTNDGGYDSTVNGWGEQNVYNPNGAGIWSNGVPITDTDGPAGSFIATAPGANQARIFQSLGVVDASDVGKVFELNGGGTAWDWKAGQEMTGNLVASFRTGTSSTSYGTRLGKVSTVYTRVFSGSNGSQDGTGDDGDFLKPFSATYAPRTADIGTEVFAVYDLHVKQDNSPSGELRFVLDNLALNVTSGYGGLATTLVNPGFDSPETGYDPLADGWLEHEFYGGVGPSGAGVGIFPAVPVTGTVGKAMVLIPNAVGDNKATAMQSLGFVNADDVGKTLEFSVDTRAWDWLDGQGETSGQVSVSFRSGMSPDGETVDFGFGELLGLPGEIVTGITAGNGSQDGIGDEGDSLATITAIYTVDSDDVGKEVFVAINVDDLTHASFGENRYVIDNAVLIPEPSGVAMAGLGLGLLAFFRRRR